MFTSPAVQMNVYALLCDSSNLNFPVLSPIEEMVDPPNKAAQLLAGPNCETLLSGIPLSSALLHMV